MQRDVTTQTQLLLQHVIPVQTSHNGTLERRKKGNKGRQEEERRIKIKTGEKERGRFAFIGPISCFMGYNLAKRLF
jgi:hypothetical protein